VIRAGSYWTDSTAKTTYPSLAVDLAVDAAVVGAGVAGLCVAWALSRSGRSVALLEGGRIAEASSGNTTAKVTVQHTSIYASLGAERAKLYAKSQTAALDQIAASGIDCDWEQRDVYTYARADVAADSLRDEAAAAAAAGLAALSITSRRPAPTWAASSGSTTPRRRGSARATPHGSTSTVRSCRVQPSPRYRRSANRTSRLSTSWM
jgi:glycine/D-amino acid oxidase-like deaminating enzyme